MGPRTMDRPIYDFGVPQNSSEHKTIGFPSRWQHQISEPCSALQLVVSRQLVPRFAALLAPAVNHTLRLPRFPIESEALCTLPGHSCVGILCTICPGGNHPARTCPCTASDSDMHSRHSKDGWCPVVGREDDAGKSDQRECAGAPRKLKQF